MGAPGQRVVGVLCSRPGLSGSPLKRSRTPGGTLVEAARAGGWGTARQRSSLTQVEVIAGPGLHRGRVRGSWLRLAPFLSFHCLGAQTKCRCLLAGFPEGCGQDAGLAALFDSCLVRRPQWGWAGVRRRLAAQSPGCTRLHPHVLYTPAHTESHLPSRTSTPSLMPTDALLPLPSPGTTEMWVGSA